MNKTALILFAGKNKAKVVFEKAGYKTYSVDANPKFNSDLTGDVMEMRMDQVPFKPYVIIASPPCPCFSVAGFAKHWDNQGRPKTAKAVRSIGNVLATLDIVSYFKPKYYFIENPVGLLRKMPFMQSHKRVTVDYCQYGSRARKPTDIFTNIEGWTPKRCHNGATCHESSPRGTTGGVQGMSNAEERAIIPKKLCEEILRVCEQGYKTSSQSRLGG
jgi:hypothetical protein